MASVSATIGEAAAVFKQLEEYPWDKDKEFQGGLAAILGPNPQPSQIHDLTLRAQCFYLSRKLSIPIDFNAYKEYLMSQPITSDSAPPPPPPQIQPLTSSQPTASSISASTIPAWQHRNGALPTSTNEPPLSTRRASSASTSSEKTAPYPQSFAEIVELITSGKPIPGIKEIPNITVPEQASKPVLPKRRKPWEKDVPQEQIDGNSGGLFGDERDIYVPQEMPDA